jgi:hypothetical protein
MIEKVNSVAEQFAASVSRRRFLGRFGQAAVAFAGALGGVLASTAGAQYVACTTNAQCAPQGWCYKAAGNCAGAGRCVPRSRCWCKPILAPVCGCNAITYPNACLAACYGVNVASAGECRRQRRR